MKFYWIIENLRWEILNINSNEPSFNPYNISVNGCSTVVIVLIIHMLDYVFLMF